MFTADSFVFIDDVTAYMNNPRIARYWCANLPFSQDLLISAWKCIITHQNFYLSTELGLNQLIPKTHSHWLTFTDSRVFRNTDSWKNTIFGMKRRWKSHTEIVGTCTHVTNKCSKFTQTTNKCSKFTQTLVSSCMSCPWFPCMNTSYT
jgi:hypothetical protein